MLATARGHKNRKCSSIEHKRSRAPDSVPAKMKKSFSKALHIAGGL